MLEEVVYSVAFLSLGVASYTDFKTREVPDWLSYATMFFGLGIRIIHSLFFQSRAWLHGLFGFGAFLLFGLLMYYTGQWGGGDSKLLMGIGGLIGLKPYLHIPDILLFWLNSILIGAIYGMVYSVVIASKNKQEFLNRFSRLRKGQRKSLVAVILLSVSALGAAFFVRDVVTKLTIILVPLASILILYLWIFLKAVEKSSMIKFVPVEKLTEGDWIVEDIVVDGERIWGPKNLGIENDKIQRLIELKEQGKITKVKVKEGIPFVPTFFMALLATYFVRVIF